MDGRKRCKNASVDEKRFISFQETENGGFRKRSSLDRALPTTDLHIFFTTIERSHYITQLCSTSKLNATHGERHTTQVITCKTRECNIVRLHNVHNYLRYQNIFQSFFFFNNRMINAGRTWQQTDNIPDQLFPGRHFCKHSVP